MLRNDRQVLQLLGHQLDENPLLKHHKFGFQLEFYDFFLTTLEVFFSKKGQIYIFCIVKREKNSRVRNKKLLLWLAILALLIIEMIALPLYDCWGSGPSTYSLSCVKDLVLPGNFSTVFLPQTGL